jgi:hypothetical protein
MKTFILASILGSAAAFAPSQKAACSTTELAAAAFDKELGVQKPLGFW